MFMSTSLSSLFLNDSLDFKNMSLVKSSIMNDLRYALSMRVSFLKMESHFLNISISPQALII